MLKYSLIFLFVCGVQVYLLKPDNMNPSFLCEQVIFNEQTIGDLKKAILKCAKAQNVLDIPYSKCRLREKHWKRVSRGNTIADRTSVLNYPAFTAQKGVFGWPKVRRWYLRWFQLRTLSTRTDRTWYANFH